MNCLRGFTRAFISAYAVKYLVGLVQALLTGRLRQRPSLIFSLFDNDTLRFAGFFGTFIGGFKGLNCLLRKWRDHDDRWNGFIAGALAGLALSIDDKQRRVAVALYLSTRSMQMAVNALQKRKILPTLEHGDTLLFALTNVEIINAFMCHPSTLAKSYYHWIYNLADLQFNWGSQVAKTVKGVLSVISNQEETPKQVLEPLLEKSRAIYAMNSQSPAQKVIQGVFGWVWGGVLGESQPAESFACSPLIKDTHKFNFCALAHPETTSCTYASCLYSLRCFPKALRIYLPLNIAMMVLWKSDLLSKNPTAFFSRIAKSSFRSAGFITIFAALAWLPPCYLRHLFGTETRLAYLINGFLSGSTVILEQPKSRRLELALYCVPRAVESIWNHLKQKGVVKPLPFGEVALFSVSMGLMMTLYQNEPDVVPKNYENIMVRFFGVN